MATKKKAEPVKQAETPIETATETPDPWSVMVPVVLHKDSDKYSKDKFVGVNGRFFMIKRGVKVMVPLPVYEVLANSIMSDAQTADYIAEKEKEAEAVQHLG